MTSVLYNLGIQTEGECERRQGKPELSAPLLSQGPNLTLSCVALAGLAFNVIFGLANDSRVDFNQYYAAGRLVGSGHLYDWDAIRTLELQHNATAVPCGRFPAFALAFKPIAWLPYSA